MVERLAITAADRREVADAVDVRRGHDGRSGDLHTTDGAGGAEAGVREGERAEQHDGSSSTPERYGFQNGFAAALVDMALSSGRVAFVAERDPVQAGLLLPPWQLEQASASFAGAVMWLIGQ